ncbi:hypothetical protein SEVIR_9G064800v4 [Setaria viridis]|uniref:Uncharacterized protein n=2 Tax=Setaria TaxID=4554 RepID=A0A368SDR8_SETIT|nr:hypothetical protein SETIT_9G065300v2 [Setaria italica]TKV90984.1 hypothetical protein SEVIR_9G064800v2 [Setaria viridis]
MLASATNHGLVAHWRGRARQFGPGTRTRCSACRSSRRARARSLLRRSIWRAPRSHPSTHTKPKEPFTATIVSVERLVGPKAPGETCHIVIDHDGNVPYWEGQSYGVIPPGENPKKPGAPHNVRR